MSENAQYAHSTALRFALKKSKIYSISAICVRFLVSFYIAGIIIFYRRSYSRDDHSCNIPILDWANCEIDVYWRWCPDASLVMEKPEWEVNKESNTLEKHSTCANEQ